MVPTDVTVVIRAAGERTEALCRQLVAEQLPEEQIFLIHEKPFARAVQRNFEIGIREGRTWTLALDADVLVSDTAIADLVTSAETLPRKILDRVYVYQGKVHCKVFGAERQAGMHLYRTEQLPAALDLIDPEGAEVRPESATYRPMRQRGYHHVKDNYCYGLHDFEQGYAALYRNGFFQARKHLTMATEILNHWIERIETATDQDFRVLLAGWNLGLSSWGEKKIRRVDIDEFERLTGEEFRQLGLDEKAPISGETIRAVTRNVAEFCNNEGRRLQHRCDDRPLLPPDVHVVRQLGAGLNRVTNWLKRYGR